MPTLISELLEPQQIQLNLATSHPAEAVAEIVALLRGNRHVLDLQRLHQAILKGDPARSTAAANGVAFPHARTEFVDEIVVAVGRSRLGISFDEKLPPVHLIFVIGTPKTMVNEYLVCIGALARRLKNSMVRQGLLEAATAAEFLACLE